MDIELFTSAVTNFGLPIALIIAFLLFGYKVYNDYKVDSKERENKLYQEIAENRAVNSKFVDVIKECTLKLDSVQKDVEDIKQKVGA